MHNNYKAFPCGKINTFLKKFGSAANKITPQPFRKKQVTGYFFILQKNSRFSRQSPHEILFQMGLDLSPAYRVTMVPD